MKLKKHKKCDEAVKDCRQYILMVEKRKMDYLLKKAGMTQKGLDKYFARIDERMAQVQIGTVLYHVDYTRDYMGEFYKQIVVDIVDSANGIVKVYEPGIDQYTKVCIDHLLFPEEIHIIEDC